MTTCSKIADYEWLTGEEACALLNDLAEPDARLHTVLGRLRGRISPERAHLVVEQADLRRRAAAKFTKAAQMFFTRTGLEQATDEWIAAYKATRFADAGNGACARAPVADLCCGIGGDLHAFAGQARGVDCSPVAAHFAAVNAGTEVAVADAAKFDLNDFAAWHIDPDRRPGGARTSSLQHCQPDLDCIEQLLVHAANAAIKLAPAAEVPEAWSRCCELEWISRDRECRQLVAWHGELAQAPGRRRASIVATAAGMLRRTITGIPDQALEIAPLPNRYVFDTDAAVRAARLTGAVAAVHGLAALGSGPSYLTGDRAIEDAALACFEVLDVLPLQLRRLAGYLRQRAIGRLEIKKRGLEIDPEKLRRDLKLRGDNAATLLLTRVAGRPSAIVAHRVALTPTPSQSALLESSALRSDA